MNIKKILLDTLLFNDNIYLDKYIQLIEDNVNTSKSKLNQRHHILPRSYFKSNHLHIDNSDSNLVYLSYSDHLKAHYYLCLCVIDSPLKYQLEFAFFSMSNEHSNSFDETSFDKYLEIYESYITTKSYMEQNREHKPCSESTKEKISLKARGRYKNHIWVNKGDIRKHIDPAELDKYLEEGFILGRNDYQTYSKISEQQRLNPNKSMLGRKQSEYQKQRVSQCLKGVPKTVETCLKYKEAHKGKILVSNDYTKESHYINPADLDIYISKSFHRGRLKK